MSGFFSTIIALTLFGSTLADILGPAPPIPRVKLETWKLKMASGENCGSTNLKLTITNKEELIRRERTGGFRKCEIEINRFDGGREDGGRISEYNPNNRECRLWFDNDEKLPYYYLESRSENEYCLLMWLFLIKIKKNSQREIQLPSRVQSQPVILLFSMTLTMNKSKL